VSKREQPLTILAAAPTLAIVFWSLVYAFSSMLPLSREYMWLLNRGVTFTLALLSFLAGVSCSESRLLIPSVVAILLGILLAGSMAGLASLYGAQGWELVILPVAGAIGLAAGWVAKVRGAFWRLGLSLSLKPRSSGDLFWKVVEAIKEFEPSLRYSTEAGYRSELAGYLKGKFPNVRVRSEMQKSSAKPDIVVGDVAIEVKGPTDRRALMTIADKLLRYTQYYRGVVVVLFAPEVTETYLSDWVKGIKRKYPDVEIIVKA